MLSLVRSALHRAITSPRGDSLAPVRIPKDLARRLNVALGSPLAPPRSSRSGRRARARLAELRAKGGQGERIQREAAPVLVYFEKDRNVRELGRIEELLAAKGYAFKRLDVSRRRGDDRVRDAPGRVQARRAAGRLRRRPRHRRVRGARPLRRVGRARAARPPLVSEPRPRALPVASFKLQLAERRVRIVPARDASGCAFAGPGVDLVGEEAAATFALARPLLAWLEAREPVRVRSLSLDVGRRRLLVTVEAEPRRPRVVKIDPGVDAGASDRAARARGAAPPAPGRGRCREARVARSVGKH